MIKRKIITLLVSFASLVYEFTLSYIMSILYGGLVKQYILTIGIYIFGLGIGSLFYEIYKQRIKLSIVELTLTILGCLSIAVPIFIFEHFYFSHFFNLLYIFSIAFLSGIELPALMDEREDSLTILGMDYLGMALASLLFPFLLLPHLGIAYTLLLTGGVNFICVLCLNEKFKFKSVSIISVLGILIFSATLNMQELLLK